MLCTADTWTALLEGDPAAWDDLARYNLIDLPEAPIDLGLDTIMEPIELGDECIIEEQP